MKMSQKWIKITKAAVLVAVIISAFLVGNFYTGNHKAISSTFGTTRTGTLGSIDPQLSTLVGKIADLQLQLDMLRARQEKTVEIQSNNATNGVLLEELTALKAQVSDLQLGLLNLTPSTSAENVYEEELLDGLNGLSPHEVIAQDEKQHFEAIHERHEAEVVNPSWSAIATQSIEDAFTDTSLSSITYSELDCRSSMCRIEVILDDDLELIDELPILLGEATSDAFTGFSIRILDHQAGSGRAEVFMNAVVVN